MTGRGLLPWAASVLRREPPSQIGTTAGLYNEETRLQSYPQEAPDPPKQGKDVPSRPAWWPIVRWTHDTQAVDEGRFVAVIVGPQQRAAYPRGRIGGDPYRSNIKVPSHVAYGSLFIHEADPYGLG